jgi:hypothetical protein
MALQVKAVQLQCGTFPRSNGDADANSTSMGSNMVGRFWGSLRTAEVRVLLLPCR